MQVQTPAEGATVKPGAVIELSSSGVLFVGLCDVIAEMDEASNATKRSNFECVYSYQAGTANQTAKARMYKARVTAEQAKMMVGEQPATGW